MIDYNEIKFVGNLLNISLERDIDTFDKVKKVLIDADVIIENDNLTFSPKESITLKEIVKIEQILDIEIISIPTEKEWLIINRKRKLEKLDQIENNES